MSPMYTMPKPLTLEEAKTLQKGQTLYHRFNRNADGTPQRWRVNGKPKTWKRRPDHVRVPLKHGLYHFDALTQADLYMLSLTNNQTE